MRRRSQKPSKLFTKWPDKFALINSLPSQAFSAYIATTNRYAPPTNNSFPFNRLPTGATDSFSCKLARLELTRACELALKITLPCAHVQSGAPHAHLNGVVVLRAIRLFWRKCNRVFVARLLGDCGIKAL